MAIVSGKEPYRRSRKFTGMIAIATVTALCGTLALGATAATASPISPAPNLPRLVGVPSTLATREHAVAIPAAATVAGGTWVLGNGLRMPLARTVVTLPAATDWPGRALHFKNTQAQALDSISSNVVPITGGAAGTGILGATSGAWATVVSDGTNWVIMAAG